MSIYKHLREFFGRLGVVVHRAEYANSVELFGNIRQLLKLHAIQLVIDVGANKGQFHDALREHCGYEGKVVSFEPIPPLADSLKNKSGDKALWEIHNCGLGDQEGSFEIDIYNRTELSSFLKGAGLLSKQEIVGREMVPVRTIESLEGVLFSKIPPEQTFLKIDTQGFDVKVMRGAGSLLRRFPFILTEVPNCCIYEGMTSFDESISFLRENSFSPAGFWAVSRGASFEAVEFDCLAVNISKGFS